MDDYATATSLVNTDPDRIRKSILRRFSPLDGIGQDLRSATTYEDALRISGLGFTPEVHKLETVGSKKPAEGYKAIFNGDKILSVVQDAYTVVSNEEAFAVAEDLVKEDGFKYEVSNMTKNGARSRLILSGPNVDIGGEVFTPYAIFNNTFDLSRSISIQFMFMRLVCLNGMMRKAPGMTSYIQLAHFGEKSSKLKKLAQFEMSFVKTLKYLQQEAQALQSVQFTREEFQKEMLPQIVSHVFHRPVNAPITQRQTVRTQAFIDSVMAAYDAQDLANFNDTAYKVLLTMTDIDSHIAPLVDHKNPDIYINRVLQIDTIQSLANFAANYLLQTRHIKV